MESSRGKSLCVPFENEEHYAACVTDLESFRQHRSRTPGLRIMFRDLSRSV